MLLKTKVEIDSTPLNGLLTIGLIPHDGNTRLMMNNQTVHALTGKYFYDDRRQTYNGFKIIQDENCSLGEVVILVDYEYMKIAMSKDNME